MIEEIDSTAYNKHYLEKVCAPLRSPHAGHKAAAQKRPLPSAVPPSPYPRHPLVPPLRPFFYQVYNEVGSDPQAFLAAALDFLKQESSFFGQPGAADTVASLVQARLPAGGAAAAAVPRAAPAAPAAAAAAAPPAADAQQAAAAAAPAAAAKAQPAEQAAAEAAGPSTLSELLPSGQHFTKKQTPAVV